MSNIFTNFRFAVVLILIITFQSFSIKTFAEKDTLNIPFKGYLYLQPSIGVSQYFGDLNLDDFWNQNPKFAFGAALGIQAHPIFGFRWQGVKSSLYSERTDHNLSLSSDLWDGAFHITVNINEIFSRNYNSKRFANFYAFTGAGVTHYKSEIKDLSTNAVVRENSSWQNTFFLPVGVGASFRLSNTFSINLEYGDRTIFDGTALDFIDNGEENNDHYSYASAGLQINIGVKDTDGDGVRDKEDLCPETFGKFELAGCPDKDNDGIADKDDVCPDVAGKAEFKGCPDTDGDGIIDSEDACPDFAGTKELTGCPDKDNDGIADKDDKCPDVAGIKELAGCPDRDGDGIADIDDACPDVKGLAPLNGCPDADGDGIADKDDKCPDVFGVVSNFGCPEVKKIDYVKVVYFNFDKTVLVTKFLKDLDEVVAVMQEYTDVRLSIEGYADSQGPAAYNLKLSEKRADFVIKYLAKQGIDKERLVKSFYGENKPVGNNRTFDGRAKNRRVEIKSID